MLRRLTAVLIILAIIGLAVILVWEVNQHRRSRLFGEESTVVDSHLTSENFALATA